MQWGFLSPDKAPVVNTWNKRGIHNSSKQVICARVKKKSENSFISFYKYSENSFLEFSCPNDVLQLHLAAIFVTSGSNTIHIAVKAC